MEIKETIAILQAFEEGKEIEYFDTGRWITIVNNLFTAFNFDKYEYRIKSHPTREEITANWVKEHGIVKGGNVRIVGENREGYVNHDKGTVALVQEILSEFIYVKHNEGDFETFETFPIESLEPYKEEYVPFTHLDYELFMNKIIIDGGGKRQIVLAFDDCDITTTRSNFGYTRAFEVFKFLDGTPFGKLK